MVIHDFSGMFTMINYTGKIFAESASAMPPNESAIIVGIIQLMGTCVSTLFLDRIGRKVNCHDTPKLIKQINRK